MEKYNKYSESLYIGKNKTSLNQNTTQTNNCSCEGLIAKDNTTEILIQQLKKEVEELMKTTQAKLLCQDKKIAQLENYIKTNLSNYLRILFDSMVQSGEIEQIIKDIIGEQNINQIEDLNQIKSDISTIQSNLENVKSDISMNIDDIRENTENINNNIEKTNSIDERVKKLEVVKDTLVVFGDSWTAPNVENAIWSNELASAMNLKLKNYALEGAGLVHNTYGTIQEQVNQFINDLDNNVIDKNKVKYVVVVGGLNDYRNNVTYDKVVNSIQSIHTSISNKIKDIKFLYVSNCQYPYQQKQFQYFKNIKSSLTNINSMNLINTIPLKYFDSTNFHLLKEGQRLFLVKNIKAILEGGSLYKESDVRIIEEGQWKITYCTTPTSDNTVDIYIEIRLTNTTDLIVEYTKPTEFIDFPYSETFDDMSSVALDKSLAVITQNAKIIRVDRNKASSTYYPLFKNIRI